MKWTMSLITMSFLFAGWILYCHRFVFWSIVVIYICIVCIMLLVSMWIQEPIIVGICIVPFIILIIGLEIDNDCHCSIIISVIYFWFWSIINNIIHIDKYSHRSMQYPFYHWSIVLFYSFVIAIVPNWWRTFILSSRSLFYYY